MCGIGFALRISVKSFLNISIKTVFTSTDSMKCHIFYFYSKVMNELWLLSSLCISSVIYLVFKSNSKYFKQKIFALILSKSDSLNLSLCLEPYKKQLFSSLHQMISHDSLLADEGSGCLRILEIGIGSGNNFKFYPNNTHLIAVEPNPHFSIHFENKLKDFPKIILEKVFKGNAEDMYEIEDNSVDVVVSTHVLCSVSDIKQCLKEIKRVLQPNGRFIYVEHVSYKSGSVQQKIQSLVEYIWKLFNDDCRLTMHTSVCIKEADFRSIEEQSVVVKQLLITLIRPHIFGIAYK